MIKPLHAAPQRRTILVYDLEWKPGSMEVRCAGVFDGRRYSHYPTVGAMLASLLTRKHRDAWIYAHAGGLADVQFVFAALARMADRYEVEASFSGSSAIIVHVRERGTRNVWHFLDSYWTLRASLKKIGASLAMAKGGPTDDMTDEERAEWYRSVPIGELVTYNEQDCRILYSALLRLEDQLHELGGELRMTLASTALALFRRAYLSETIATDPAVNDLAEQAYHASRVEVFDRECGEANYYDINSSFPHAMRSPLPGNLLRSGKRLAHKQIEDPKIPCLAKVSLEVPVCYLPILPYRRKDSRVFFPTGKWESWFTGTDLRLALENGAKIRSCSEVKTFEPNYDLRRFAEDIYMRRKASKDDFQRLVYKLLANSAYGKFAERQEKRRLHIQPGKKALSAIEANARGRGFRSAREAGWMLSPGIFLEPVHAKVPHRHVPFSAEITSIARSNLARWILRAGKCHYTDTDSIITPATLPCSAELGDLKLERRIRRGEFVMPKLYRLDSEAMSEEGEWEREIAIRAKGFSIARGRKKDETEEACSNRRFQALLEGDEIEATRMRRVIENFRAGPGVPDPVEKECWKGINIKEYFPKRKMFSDGSTRPWSVGEIEAGG